MKARSLMVALIATLIPAAAFATTFDCNGRAQNEDGEWQKVQITVEVTENSVDVKEEGGTQLGFDMHASFDENYRPSAKYAGYYRYNARVNGTYNDVLVQKPMRDNKRARAGAVVFQGTEEDGGIAAYFDSCSRAN